MAAVRFGGHAQSSRYASRERLPSAAGIVPERLVRSGRRENAGGKHCLKLEQEKKRSKCRAGILSHPKSPREVAAIRFGGTHRAAVPSWRGCRERLESSPTDLFVLVGENLGRRGCLKMRRDKIFKTQSEKQMRKTRKSEIQQIPATAEVPTERSSLRTHRDLAPSGR